MSDEVQTKSLRSWSALDEWLAKVEDVLTGWEQTREEHGRMTA